MKLVKVEYILSEKIVVCSVEFSPPENEVVVLKNTIQESELEAIKFDWWIAEIKQVLSTKLNTVVI